MRTKISLRLLFGYCAIAVMTWFESLRSRRPEYDMKTQLITIDPDIHSGTPVFAGTRVPIKTLFDHLEAGESLESFLNDFPSVSRELAIAVL